MAFPYDTKKVTLGGPMASNAIAGTGDMFPNTADINFGPASPPVGGPNASSMIAGAKKPGLFSTTKAMPRAGYMLGRAAQAIMGQYQNSPAALLGGVGAELSQQEAQKRTMARLIAGEQFEEIEEASLLSPQQQQIVIGQSAERRKQNFEETKFKTEMEAKWADLKQKGQLTDAQVENLRAEAGFTKKKVESFETPAEARKADTAARKELISAEGEETRKTEEVKHANRLKELEKSIAGEISTIVKRGELDEKQGESLTKTTLGAATVLSEFVSDPEELLLATKKLVNTIETGAGRPAPYASAKQEATGIIRYDAATKKYYKDGIEVDRYGKPIQPTKTPRG